MALTKERKVLLGLLGSAGLILGLDQLFLGPPKQAAATVPESAPDPQALPSSQTSTTSETTTTMVAPAADSSSAVSSWNERLAALHADAKPEDELDTATGSSVALDPFAKPTTNRSDADARITASQFASQHRLSAVVTSNSVGVAMVNGKAVRVGEEISGYRLVRVDTRSAEFESGGDIVRLEIPVQVRGGS